jgi:branched-chain amino acid transport system permease protein
MNGPKPFGNRDGSSDEPAAEPTADPRPTHRPVGRWYVLLPFALLCPLALPYLSLAYVTAAAAFALAILGVNLMAGFVGRVALGHGAFVGAGAYTTVILSADHSWPVLATVPAAAGVGFLLGSIIGLPALRIRGLHLALVTLAFGAAFGPVIKRLGSLTEGANGKGSTASFVAPTWLGEGRQADMRWWYVAVTGVAMVVFILVRNLTVGRVGRALVALRDNELAAKTSGVQVGRYTLAMFGCSAAVASVGGALLMLRQPFASYLSYETPLSLQLYAAATIGGLTSLGGAVIGGMVLIAVPYAVRRVGIEIDDNILFGSLLIVAVLFLPGGLATASSSRSRTGGRRPRRFRRTPGETDASPHTRGN